MVDCEEVHIVLQYENIIDNNTLKVFSQLNNASFDTFSFQIG